MAALVFVEDLETPELNADDAHHLGEVLRLRPGELVGAADGAGSWRICTFTGTGARSRQAPRAPSQKGHFGLEAAGPVLHLEPASPVLEIGFSWAKAERTEWAVAKLVELGLDILTPLVADRTVVRPDRDGAARRTERLQRIVRESAMQSRRPFLPRISESQTVDEVASRARIGALALAEPGGSTVSLDTPVILVGPEGGFSPRELALVDNKVSLGDGVLRVETAAVAAGVLLSALRSAALVALR
ncbi:MAG: RsmE family RNA methyltransferase [Acidimicrobiales bacterium]